MHVLYFRLSPPQKGAERAAGSTIGKKYSWHLPNVWEGVVPGNGWVGTRPARLMLVNLAVEERKAQEWVSLRKMFVIIRVSGCHVNRMQKPSKEEESKIGQVVWEKQAINCSSGDCKEQRAFEKRGIYFCPCHFFPIFVLAKLLQLLQKQGLWVGTGLQETCWNGWADLAERGQLKVIRLKSPVEQDGALWGYGMGVLSYRDKAKNLLLSCWLIFSSWLHSRSNIAFFTPDVANILVLSTFSFKHLQEKVISVQSNMPATIT